MVFTTDQGSSPGKIKISFFSKDATWLNTAHHFHFSHSAGAPHITCLNHHVACLAHCCQVSQPSLASHQLVLSRAAKQAFENKSSCHFPGTHVHIAFHLTENKPCSPHLISPIPPPWGDPPSPSPWFTALQLHAMLSFPLSTPGCHPLQVFALDFQFVPWLPPSDHSGLTSNVPSSPGHPWAPQRKQRHPKS